MAKSAGLFSLEADLLVDAAIRWLEDRRHEVIPPITPFIRPTGKRPFTDQDCAALRAMAKTAVWQEVGGRAAGASNDWDAKRLGLRDQRELNEEGIGRTHWVGMPEWAQGFGMNREEITAAVEKAINGERIGSKQRNLLQSMIDALYETRS